MEIWFHKNDPELVTYRKTLDEMGEWEWLAVVLDSKTNLYDRNFLVELQDIGNQIAKLSKVKKVISIANARHTVNDKKGLEYRIMFDNQQPIEDGLDDKLKQDLLNNPIVVDTIIKKDNDNTTVILVQDANNFDDGGLVRVDLVNDIRAIIDDAQYISRYSIVGTSALNATLNTNSLHDIETFNPLVSLICIVFGWWVFGNWRDLIIAMSLVYAVVSLTVSAVIYSGIELNMATVMLPPILTSLSMASVVHVITHFHQLRETSADLSSYTIARQVIRNLWIPCMGAALTTIAGFISLELSGIVPLMQLGLFSAAGIFLGFILNMTIVPLLLVYFWNGKSYRLNTASGSLNIYASEKLKKLAIRILEIKIPIFLFFGLVAVLTLPGLRYLGADSSYLLLFDNQSEIRADYRHVEKSGFPASSIRVFIEMENGLEDPETFLALNEFQQTISKLPAVNKVVSPIDGLKEIDRSIAEDDHWSENDYLNYGRETFAQLLFLSELSNNDDMQDLLLLNNKTGQMFLFTPYLSNSEIKKLSNEIETLIANHLPTEIKASVTGVPVLWANTDRYLFSSQVHTLMIMSIAILATLFLATRSLELSFIGLCVNLLPVMTIVAVMSWLDIKLDIGTVVIGGIALGLAVDDTIHFLWHYVQKRKINMDVRQALISTIQSTGIAIILTSILIATSFSVMMTSDFTPTSNFGLFTSAAILLAMVVDLFLLPAIMIAIYERKSNIGSAA